MDSGILILYWFRIDWVCFKVVGLVIVGLDVIIDGLLFGILEMVRVMVGVGQVVVVNCLFLI